MTSRKPSCPVSRARISDTHRGSHLVVWNRGAAKSEELKAKYPDLVTVAATPGEVRLGEEGGLRRRRRRRVVVVVMMGGRMVKHDHVNTQFPLKHAQQVLAQFPLSSTPRRCRVKRRKQTGGEEVQLQTS